MTLALPAAANAWRNASVGKRRLAVALLVIAVALMSWPVASIVPQAGLDPSWQAALHLAAYGRLHFGSDLVFTYGPLGFLTIPELYFAPTGMLSFAFVVLVHGLAVTVMLRRGLMTHSPVVIGLVVALAVLVLPALGPSRALVAIVALLAVESIEGPSLGRFQRWLPPILGVISACAVLMKFNDGVVIAIVGLIIAAVQVRTAGWRPLAELGLGFALAFAVVWVATGQRPEDVVPFLYGSYQIAAGYSTAMGLETPGRQLEYVLALVVVAMLAGLVLTSTRAWPLASRLAMLAIGAVLLFIGFKHGFVRHDNHSIGFFALVLVLVVSVARRPTLWLFAAVGTGVLGLLVAGSAPGIRLIDPIGHATSFVQQSATIALPEGRARTIRDAQLAMRDEYAIPDAFVTTLADGTVHVYPQEVSVIWAYYPALEWDPAPVFQAYAAYTPYLDELNADFLASPDAPDRILRANHPPIDARNPIFESPAASLSMICHYRQELAGPDWQVLERVADRCGVERSLGTRTAAIGEWVDPPAAARDEIVYARVHAVRGGVGEGLRSMLFRAEPATIVVRDRGSWRIPPLTAADPLILGVPAHLDYSGRYGYPQEPRAFRIVYSDDPKAQGSISVEFFAVRLQPRSTLVYAHRGDTAVAGQNTLEGISAARRWADGVEIDLHLAPDGTFRLGHGPLDAQFGNLPTIDQAVASAGELALDLDLKDAGVEIHRLLGQWIADHGIASRTTVNVKSLAGARAIRAIAPEVTIEAQPDWIPTAATAADVDLVLVWGDDWREVLDVRPPDEVALFVNSINEPGADRLAEANEAGIARYLADGPP